MAVDQRRSCVLRKDEILAPQTVLWNKADLCKLVQGTNKPLPFLGRGVDPHGPKKFKQFVGGKFLVNHEGTLHQWLQQQLRLMAQSCVKSYLTLSQRRLLSSWTLDLASYLDVSFFQLKQRKSAMLASHCSFHTHFHPRNNGRGFIVDQKQKRYGFTSTTKKYYPWKFLAMW